MIRVLLCMFHVNPSFRESRYITGRSKYVQNSSVRVSFRFYFVPSARTIFSTPLVLSFSEQSFPAATLAFQSPLPPKPVVASGRSLPLAALCAYNPIQNVESDTLEADTRDPEGTGSKRLVHVLRGGVLPAPRSFL